LVMLPALMTWFTRHRTDEPAAIATSPEARRAALRRRYDPRQNVPTPPHASPVHRPDTRKTAA
ncbi:MAG TPA: hypothetical protein VHD36_14835, partial [Pirellulales bacterium]|nr:hypothetical protein [Pirellulales bacterium]